MGVVSVDEADITGGSSDITVDNTTLIANQMPSHTHNIYGASTGQPHICVTYKESSYILPK